MKERNIYLCAPPPEPIPVTQQEWPDYILPIVTTRVTAYMHESYTGDCIEGILMQKTTFPVEVVVHEDASTDKTADIVREYDEKYPKLIRAIYQTENQFSKPGRGKIRDNIKNVTLGKYIAICKGNDYWTDPLKLQKQGDFLEANSAYSMCFHNAEVRASDRLKHKRNLFDHLQSKDYSGKELLEKWTIPTASVVYRREYADKILQHPDFLYNDIISFFDFGRAW